ncbi:MAG TPA: bestrophin family ion channel [Bryobacteraceae bacterium]|nr:bestrophin family ion channel [Bryobacteraceae bacterium]
MLPRYVGRPLAILFAFDVVVVVAYVFAGWTWIALPDIPLSIFGGLIGVVAGFRNSSAYARWWEARTIWGGVVNHSRNFAREVLSMVSAPGAGEAEEKDLCERKRELVRRQIAYVHALRNHLRGIPPWPELTGLISDEEMAALADQSNIPLAIQQNIACKVARCYQLGWLDNMRWARFDQTLSSLMDCQGAAERIKNTPIPWLYDAFIRLFINIFCILLPLAMVDTLHLFTPLGSTFVGFIFLALDQIGRDLEAPFENLPQDIPIAAISRTIEINLKEMIGEKQIPEPLGPVNGVLW